MWLSPVFILMWIILIPLSQATIYITVTGANIKRAKLVLGQIHPLSNMSVDAALAKRVREQLRQDLEFTDLFDFIHETMFEMLDKATDVYNAKYDDFSVLGASFVLKLGYKVEASKLILETVLFDVAGRKKIFGTRYQYPPSQYYRLVHAIAEDVLKELTGERGLFLSRVVMSCRTFGRRNPHKEIFVVDADGRNPVQLTLDKTISLSPSWSPDGKWIAYSQFEWRRFGNIRKKGIVLKKHNLVNGERQVLSAREGMNSGASWAPSGKKIAATLSFTGRPEVYLLNPVGESEPEPISRVIQWRRLSGEGYQVASPHMLLDVEPQFSPSGDKLVLSSARSGHPMIYVVDLSTKIANQLTFAGVYNASPAWSPKGDRILFAAQRTGEGNFDLYVIDTDGNNLSRVTSGDRGGTRRINSENPSWAPTGRHLVFASNEGGTYGVYVMTLDGAVKRKISPPDKECFTPSWGPPEG